MDIRGLERLLALMLGHPTLCRRRYRCLEAESTLALMRAGIVSIQDPTSRQEIAADTRRTLTLALTGVGLLQLDNLLIQTLRNGQLPTIVAPPFQAERHTLQVYKAENVAFPVVYYNIIGAIGWSKQLLQRQVVKHWPHCNSGRSP